MFVHLRPSCKRSYHFLLETRAVRSESYRGVRTVSQSTHSKPVDIENRTVVIPREEDTTKEEEPIEVWPLVEAALTSMAAWAAW